MGSSGGRIRQNTPVATWIPAVLAILAIMASSARASQFAGGSGTAADPYQIATAEQLISIGSDPNLLGSSFVLIGDIDLDPNLPGGRVFDRAVISSNPYLENGGFRGTFDGNGHTICKMTVEGPRRKNYLGLFDAISASGRIRNLRIEEAMVKSDYATGFAGLLAGSSKGSIINCGVSGSIAGWESIGGLVGSNEGTIAQCFAHCDISGLRGELGGLVGLQTSGTITNSYATGSVSGPEQDCVGGLVGNDAGDSIISNSYAAVAVSGTQHIGGLVGCSYTSSTIRYCFWDTDISGPSWSAGGFGRTTAQMKTARTFVRWTPEWTIDEGKDYPHLAWEMTPGRPLANSAERTYMGAGTSSDPFVLCDANDMASMMARPEDWSSCFVLAQDIDMAPVEFWLPMDEFAGTLDGRNHRILNLTIRESTQLLGLIGYLRSGWVRNLDLADVNVEGYALYTGALVAYNDHGSVRNCRLSGSIAVGGVRKGAFGYGCEMGGLVGRNDGGTISRSRTASNVITRGGWLAAGGLVGVNYGQVTECCATGSISDGTEEGPDVAGLVGNNSGSICNCYVSGRVVAEHARSCAGLTFCNWGGVTSSYSRAVVTAGPTTTEAGGLVGWNQGNVANSFWDVEESGLTQSDGGTGLPTAQMVNVETYRAAGWDFVHERSGGTCDLWCMPEGDSYPELAFLTTDYQRPALAGGGTPDDPYLVATAEDLGALCHYDDPACYVMAADIDLSGIVWSQACIPEFEGGFDGGGHTISSLTIRGGGNLGLFGHIRARGSVAGLHLHHADVTVGNGGTYIGRLAASSAGSIRDCSVAGRLFCAGASHCSGMLIGISTGEITGCHVAGSIRASNEANCLGGAAGDNRGDMTDCDAEVNITCARGGWMVGGLAGLHSRSGGIGADGVVNCHAVGDLSAGVGMSEIGGLIGSSDGAVSHCYATGNILTGDESDRAAGLIGSSFGPVADCYATGDIAGTYKTDRFGGLIGSSWSSVVSRCSASGRVSGYGNIGGLVGWADECTVNACYAVGDVSGPYADSYGLGGLMGHVEASKITDCYARGAVSGDRYVGGLVGYAARITVDRCYATGALSGSRYPAGLFGLEQSGTYHNCFWNVQTSGQILGANLLIEGQSLTGVAGLSTAQMRESTTYRDATWDFETVWTICEGKDYPRLQWEGVACK